MTEESVTSRWRITLAAISVAVVGLIALFYSTAAGMVSIWYHFETYTHGFIIVPITLWLIWQKRAHLAAYTPQPSAIFLVLICLGLLGWSLSRLTGVLVVEQFALVGIVITTVAALVGWQVAKFLAFPLLFLLFAVPMGEDLVPPMMEFTATFTVSAIKLTGIPVYRDGLWFSLPSGNWSVVEACSGVRYLIASVTLGVMYAYVTYHTLWKRLLFILMSAIVPILANGLRAYMIVMIGHFSEMEYATGVDHLIYGWFFFGIVMFILFWVGSFWQEEEDPPVAVKPAHVMTSSSVGQRLVVLSAVILSVSALTVWMTTKAESIEAQVVADFDVSAQLGGWQRMAEPTLWQPRHQETPDTVSARYRNAAGDEVQLFVVLFAQQRQGSEAINNQNEIAGQKVHQTSLGSKTVDTGSSKLPVNQSKLIIDASNGENEHLVWQWYRVAGHEVINRYVGKAWEALARLYPGRADGAWIAVTTPFNPKDADQAQQRLAEFVRVMSPEVQRAIDGALGYSD